MDKKRTEIAGLTRRDALKRIGRCAEYTGTVVALLSVSQPSWASHNKGHGKDCNTGGGTSNIKIASCADDEGNHYGQISSSSSGNANSSNASSGGSNASSGSSNASSASSSGGSVSNSASSQVDESPAGPAYQ